MRGVSIVGLRSCAPRPLSMQRTQSSPTSSTECVINSEAKTTSPSWTLAYAAVYDIPVVPNTADVAHELARYHAELVSTGFVLGSDEGKDGEVHRYRVAHHRRLASTAEEFLEDLDVQRVLGPAELIVMKELFEREFAERARGRPRARGASRGDRGTRRATRASRPRRECTP